MQRFADKLAAFGEAVHETYDQDGLGPTLIGIGWFLPTAVLESVGVISVTR